MLSINTDLEALSSSLRREHTSEADSMIKSIKAWISSEQRGLQDMQREPHDAEVHDCDCAYDHHHDHDHEHDADHDHGEDDCSCEHGHHEVEDDDEAESASEAAQADSQTASLD